MYISKQQELQRDYHCYLLELQKNYSHISSTRMTKELPTYQFISAIRIAKEYNSTPASDLRPGYSVCFNFYQMFTFGT